MWLFACAMVGETHFKAKSIKKKTSSTTFLNKNKQCEIEENWKSQNLHTKYCQAEATICEKQKTGKTL